MNTYFVQLTPNARGFFTQDFESLSREQQIIAQVVRVIPINDCDFLYVVKLNPTCVFALKIHMHNMKPAEEELRNAIRQQGETIGQVIISCMSPEIFLQLRLFARQFVNQDEQVAFLEKLHEEMARLQAG